MLYDQSLMSRLTHWELCRLQQMSCTFFMPLAEERVHVTPARCLGINHAQACNEPLQAPLKQGICQAHTES